MAQVINTNSLSLLTQNNLNKSQASLNTAIQRLSSGMRINSAKDDAAGQAIANRFTANIKGLTQASRNANDGISMAQTTEGALTEINANLQRIRELAVQSVNGSNSDADKVSIQNEITQRLEEIDRTSAQTDFNGTKVLDGSKTTVKIQIGANDGESISIDLKEISAKTLGLAGFSIGSSLSSSGLSAAGTTVTFDAPVDVTKTATALANSAVPVAGTVQGEDGIYAMADGSGFVVKGADDGKYYALEKNAVTDKWQWDSNTTAITTGVDESAVATSLPVNLSDVGGNYATMIGVGGSGEPTDTNGGTVPKLANGATDFASDGQLYKLNTGDDSATGTTHYAIKGNDGKFYAATVALSDAFDADGVTAGSDGVNDTFTVEFDSSALVEVSVGNVIGGNNTVGDTAGAITDIRVDDETPTASDDLLNVATSPADTPTASGVYALSAGGYAVKGSDNAYYKANVDNNTGNVSWDSSSTAAGNVVAAGDVDVAGGAVTQVVTGQLSTGITTGLATGESLQKYTEGGSTKYAVKGTDVSGNTYYHAATLNTDGTSADVGQITKTLDANSAPEALTVDATSTLDRALSKVDALRSSLGAVQNRFDSVISNLGTTITNLTASRSRIEDADYATEVSNMTRANILQQAGTSVLAQANQTTQGVLSLLR